MKQKSFLKVPSIAVADMKAGLVDTNGHPGMLDRPQPPVWPRFGYGELLNSIEKVRHSWPVHRLCGYVVKLSSLQLLSHRREEIQPE